MTKLKLISLNVGLPREVNWNGKTIMTGIFKEPVDSTVMLRSLNLDGDRQADLSVHGGVSKAVYAYPAEHYEYWLTELPEMRLPYGMFGENFTTEGLLESDVNVGDRFRVGEAEVVATEPRMPCYKLGIKFGRADILKRFLASRRTGFYFAVLKEGRVKAGDSIELLSKDKNSTTVADIVRLYAFEKDDLELLQRVVKLDALSESWRGYFKNQLTKLTQ
ncbi:MAG TPA: MOSC domain-containing protein [Pyrinomonadaceae bacterium]